MKFFLLIFCVVSLLCSCQNDPAANKFSDPSLVKISDLQDRRSGDSLASVFDDTNVAYRRAACLAFGSLQDSAYASKLQNLLISDPDAEVRRFAAYSLGQTPCIQSLQALGTAADREENLDVLSEVIQSYGKVAQAWSLDISRNDSVISSALAWGYYRMAVRGKSDSVLNEKSAAYLKSATTETRLAAAHYFARGAQRFEKFTEELIFLALKDQFPDIRMAAVLALGKVRSDASLQALSEAAINDSDYRVRINAVRALQDFPFDRTRDILLKALTDSNINVGVTASEAISQAIKPVDATHVFAIARGTKNWRIQANLLGAVMSASYDEGISDEIQSMYKTSKNPYQKAALLTTLQYSHSSLNFLATELTQATLPVIKSSAAAALVALNRNTQPDRLMANDFVKIYQRAIDGGDMAVIGIVCAALADTSLHYKSIISNFDFLKTARNKLSLPRDYESVVPLEEAIAYFEGRSAPVLKNQFNHPIDWDLVRKIPSNQKAVIKTSKGVITLRLFVDDAPGSVANFVMLAQRKFYDNRIIHRVAPNFVVQDGCPRGDGWGSEPYSIRSEFTPVRYRTGSIGMASAGKDTEGTQWFITHSPTPHLEGRYTLFAEVVDGMQIVHELEVGDQVLAIEIIDF
jgi:cyclophilin family peptidyl-prolyl cis-trans isomerase/HEAT repeat protein